MVSSTFPPEVSFRVVDPPSNHGFLGSRESAPIVQLTDVPSTQIHGWRRGVVVSGVRRMNKVNARRARLVLGWVTVFGRVYHLGM